MSRLICYLTVAIAILLGSEPLSAARLPSRNTNQAFSQPQLLGKIAETFAAPHPGMEANIPIIFRMAVEALTLHNIRVPDYEYSWLWTKIFIKDKHIRGLDKVRLVGTTQNPAGNIYKTVLATDHLECRYNYSFHDTLYDKTGYRSAHELISGIQWAVIWTETDGQQFIRGIWYLPQDNKNAKELWYPYLVEDNPQKSVNVVAQNQMENTIGKYLETIFTAEAIQHLNQLLKNHGNNFKSNLNGDSKHLSSTRNEDTTDLFPISFLDKMYTCTKYGIPDSETYHFENNENGAVQQGTLKLTNGELLGADFYRKTDCVGLDCLTASISGETPMINDEIAIYFNWTVNYVGVETQGALRLVSSPKFVGFVGPVWASLGETIFVPSRFTTTGNMRVEWLNDYYNP